MNKNTWKTALPILAVGIAAWAIYVFVKPSVYDIKVPEKRATEITFTESKGIAIGKREAAQWDSVTYSNGVAVETLDSSSSYSIKKAAIPLQYIAFWKDGFAYYQVLTFHGDWPDDTCCSAGGDVLANIGYYDQVQSGIFQENYEGSEVLLRLEQKKPVKIIALWNNFPIQGETDGEQIKIQIPACATKERTSILRVWCAYTDHVSPVCEIPLVKGLVASRYSQVSSLRPEARFNAIKPMCDVLVDSLNSSGIVAALMDVSENAELKMAISFGDLRVKVEPTYTAIVFSYFGKKVVVIQNRLKANNAIALPLKGDLKHSYSGRAFTIKGGKILLTLPANGHEIIW